MSAPLAAALALLAGGPAGAATCDALGEASQIAQIEAAPPSESSGLAASRTRPGVWFTHDDSGGEAEIYGFTLDGASEGAHPVEGANFFDWEALSPGPCPDGGDCLYIGDIGDNLRVRPWISVYAIPEPGPGESAEVIAIWNATWPGGPRDAEALAVHPISGQIVVISKDAEGASTIAAFPEAPTGPDEVVELDLLAEWAVEGGSEADRYVTGADWSPAGDQIAVRTYTEAWISTADPCDEGGWWTSLAPIALGDGGEAIAWSLDGGLVTTVEGTPAPIFALECLAAGESPAPCPEPDTGAGLDPSEEGGCGGGRAWALGPLLLGLRLRRGRRGSPVGSHGMR